MQGPTLLQPHTLEKRCGQRPYLLRVAVELAEDVEERHLGDDQLLLLVLVERSRGQVQGQEEEGGLGHLLLVLLRVQQRLLLLRRLSNNTFPQL